MACQQAAEQAESFKLKQKSKQKGLKARKLDQGSPSGSMAPSLSPGLMMFTTGLGLERASICLMRSRCALGTLCAQLVHRLLCSQRQLLRSFVAGQGPRQAVLCTGPSCA